MNCTKANWIVILLSVLFLRETSFDARGSNVRTELSIYQFSANKTHYAFLHQLSDTERVLVFYQPLMRDLKVYRSKSAIIRDLSPSASERGFYVSEAEIVTPSELKSGRPFTSTLLRCSGTSRCERVFSFDGSIAQAADVGSGGLIFVGGEAEVTSRSMRPIKKFVAPRRFEIYWRDGNQKPRELTSWKSPELKSLSFANNELAFQKIGDPGRETGPDRSNSEIYLARLTSSGNLACLDDGCSTPALEYGRKLDAAPSMSADATKIAFYSASESAGQGWRYDIAIFNRGSKQVEHTIQPAPGTQLSHPIFIDEHRIRFLSFDGSTYSFQEFDTVTRKQTELGRLSLADVRAAFPEALN